eukprot:jgi/Chlat1/210/Chrsp1S03122
MTSPMLLSLSPARCDARREGAVVHALDCLLHFAPRPLSTLPTPPLRLKSLAVARPTLANVYSHITRSDEEETGARGGDDEGEEGVEKPSRAPASATTATLPTSKLGEEREGTLHGVA